MQAYLHSAAFWNLYSKGIITAKDLQENEKFFTTLVHAIAPRTADRIDCDRKSEVVRFFRSRCENE
jgi:hypothetical protein